MAEKPTPPDPDDSQTPDNASGAQSTPETHDEPGANATRGTQGTPGQEALGAGGGSDSSGQASGLGETDDAGQTDGAGGADNAAETVAQDETGDSAQGDGSREDAASASAENPGKNAGADDAAATAADGASSGDSQGPAPAALPADTDDSASAGDSHRGDTGNTTATGPHETLAAGGQESPGTAQPDAAAPATAAATPAGASTAADTPAPTATTATPVATGASPSATPAPAGTTAKKRSRMPLIVTLSVVGVALIGYIVAGLLSGMRVGTGVSIGGVDVSGQSVADARTTLQKAADDRHDKKLRLTAGGKESGDASGTKSTAKSGGEKSDAAADDAEKDTKHPARKTVTTSMGDLGLSVDVDRSVGQAAGFTLNPVTIVNRLFGQADLPAVLTDDTAANNDSAGDNANASAPAHRSTGTASVTPSGAGDEAVQKAAKQLSSDSKPAGITIKKGRAELVKSTPGLTVDSKNVRKALGDYPGGTKLNVDGNETDPEVSDAAALKVRDDVAKPALKRDLTLKASGDGGKTASLRLDADVVAKHLKFTPDGDTLKPDFNEKNLQAALEKQNPRDLTAGKDASFKIKDRKPVVVPSRTGISVGAKQLTDRVKETITDGKDTANVTLKVRQPELTTAAAKKLEMKRISKFATPYDSESARDTNLRVATGRVSGTVVKPGDTFSLNKAIKKRTAANGYQRAGVISGGEMKEDYGGGVSQVSTTLFNAAFFAGQRLDDHQAHSRWIERYPEGRESTLDWNSIEMAFTNTGKTPVVLDMYLKDGKVHAQIFGKKNIKVTSKSSKRFNYTSPQTITKPDGDSCSPQSPKRGWSITIHRTVKNLDTGKTSRDQFTTVYKPVNAIRCGSK